MLGEPHRTSERIPSTRSRPGSPQPPINMSFVPSSMVGPPDIYPSFTPAVLPPPQYHHQVHAGNGQFGSSLLGPQSFGRMHSSDLLPTTAQSAARTQLYRASQGEAGDLRHTAVSQDQPPRRDFVRPFPIKAPSQLVEAVRQQLPLDSLCLQLPEKILGGQLPVETSRKQFHAETSGKQLPAEMHGKLVPRETARQQLTKEPVSHKFVQLGASKPTSTMDTVRTHLRQENMDADLSVRSLPSEPMNLSLRTQAKGIHHSLKNVPMTGDLELSLAKLSQVYPSQWKSSNDISSSKPTGKNSLDRLTSNNSLDRLTGYVNGDQRTSTLRNDQQCRRDEFPRDKKQSDIQGCGGASIGRFGRGFSLFKVN